MELELGLKITHSRDDLTCTTDLCVTKDPSGPPFVPKEIETMFILVGHLKGFRRENIDIDINKDGNRIAIHGKKPVQEMVLKGWIMQKKEAVMRTFNKIFRIPDGVILDKIKAKFNDETSTLTIRMPKLVKGNSGFGIEEVDEEEEVQGERFEPTPQITVVDKVAESESPKEETQQESKQPKKMENFDQVVAGEAPKEDQTMEQKVKALEDSGQVVEQATDRQSEATKIPDRDDNKETVEKKPEEPIKEIEFRKLEDEIERGTDCSRTAKQSTEERASEKGLEEHVHVPDSIQSTKSIDDQVTEFPSSSTTQVEEKHEKPKELQKQEYQQLTKPEPHQEPKADDQTIKEEVHTQADEIKETPTHQEENLSQEKVVELKCQKSEKQRSSNEEAAQGKKPALKRSKVCTPIVVAGSVFLVSILVLVINFIRAKKR
ncbi:hypothetical protein Ddye_005566 [Dipteronia dyeriana]|uniref:SHSP domain-containing protein n=1 Tax=Dipteronia dyeriana TaxID=168575 RepID=A0AAD9XHD4_9ROSI|nr:hypothetical protein Ddye_005566 [Dipteronia dyeriana]